jgi:WD40 repeat protein
VFLLEKNRHARELDAPPTDARSLTFSPRGDRLYGGGWFRLFRWELASGGLDVISTDHWGVISSMQFVPGGTAIATISRVNDSAVLFLDPESGETLRDLRRHPVCGTKVALSPDGRYLANTGDDGVVRLFDLENPRLR